MPVRQPAGEAASRQAVADDTIGNGGGQMIQLQPTRDLTEMSIVSRRDDSLLVDVLERVAESQYRVRVVRAGGQHLNAVMTVQGATAREIGQAVEAIFKPVHLAVA
jgi:hypothetical protein